MNSFDPEAYGPVFAPLVAIDRRRPLDAGKPETGAAAALNMLSVQTAFAHVSQRTDRKLPVDLAMAACCVAGVWLLHDCLDESHSISQGIDMPSGSFWHAIMHRREGNFSNAKYWFRRVGRHPVFEMIGEQAHVAAVVRNAEACFGETRLRGWDPFAFVDLCQSVARGKSEARDLCLDIQQAEWEVLFDYCYGAAVTV